MRPEQQPALQPTVSSFVARGDVRVSYDVYGDGAVTVLLLPPWAIVSSRAWKAQVPYLARHFRVVTFDGRGSGRSSRPVGAVAYADREYAADALAVLDASATASAVVVAHSAGVPWALHLASGHPDRVLGLFAIDPSCAFTGAAPRGPVAWDERTDGTEGWALYNKHHWLGGHYDEFRRFFFAQMFPEPHSTKQIEDCLRWSADIAPQTLCDTTAGRLGLEGATFDPLEPLSELVRCPVQVVHGTEDRIRSQSLGQRLAELTGGHLLLLHDVGHGPAQRQPVLINHLIHEFADKVAVSRRAGATPGAAASPYAVPSSGPAEQGAAAARHWHRALSRRRRILYLSSPIGLGHVCRDLAIAGELRKQRPGVQIDWLAQDPVTRVLRAADEHVHPASDYLCSESELIESETEDHDLHVFEALRRMDERFVANFMVFDEVARGDDYDLVVGDEAWDVDYFLHENPELKRFGYVWMTDFVGYLPMPDGGTAEQALTADYNAEMIEQRARFPRVRERSVFIGNPDDIVPQSFGPGLPPIREWTEREFDFAGYVTGFEPPDSTAAAALRMSLGYRPADKICVVTVGGSGVGMSLLHRVLDAVPLARRLMPELHFLIVAGPRIDPSTLPRRRGAHVRGYLPRLYEHLAACDIAVVQGGLTTCMELVASRRPFIYVPLEHHFEQQLHVRHRLAQYDAGLHMSYAQASDPRLLAETIVKAVSTRTRYRPVETDGAARAAALIADVL